MRLFVGIFPPPTALEHLWSEVAGLGLTRRVIPQERWHLTLSFLGEVDEAAEGAARKALEGTPASIGELRLRGAGRFGAILWVGVEGDVSGLSRANRALRRALRQARLHPDDKRFRPHLTVARPGDELSPEALARLRSYEGPRWPVTELVLIRSELGPHPQYHRLGAWPVTGAGA